MDERFARLAARAAKTHNVLTREDFAAAQVTRHVRSRWLSLGIIVPLGVGTWAIAGPAPTWTQRLSAGLVALGPSSVIAGRSGAALQGLDGFRPGASEFMAPRAVRNRSVDGRVVATQAPIPPTDVLRIDGLRCVRAERLILDAALFDFTKAELENAIDSALRLHLISEERLRDRAEAERPVGARGGRQLRDALVDAGGHSALERAFLRILRQAGIPRPNLQVTHRDGARFVARVDTLFGSELVIEVDGHRTHSSRRQRQTDAQRRTELTILGKRVIHFTYDDVMGRPEWTIDRVREAVSRDCLVSPPLS